ncbi:hypothetical protein EIP86_003778 [Pleurotus ostreatoroseus]|nr:hypothetical protein EIP86_003778 [Pleurotus ostreatoroseus]
MSLLNVEDIDASVRLMPSFPEASQAPQADDVVMSFQPLAGPTCETTLAVAMQSIAPDQGASVSSTVNTEHLADDDTATAVPSSRDQTVRTHPGSDTNPGPEDGPAVTTVKERNGIEYHSFSEGHTGKGRRRAKKVRFVDDPLKRAKRYSERVARVLEAVSQYVSLLLRSYSSPFYLEARNLQTATEPYCIVFCARPESLLSPRGLAKVYISPAMYDVVPDVEKRLDDILKIMKKNQKAATPDAGAMALVNRAVAEAQMAQREMEEKLASERRRRESLERQLAQLQSAPSTLA